jgi:hypothetical protein
LATELRPDSPDVKASFDEDEDLFRFDELYAESPDATDESEIDLEDFLKSFAAEEPDASRVEAVLDTGGQGVAKSAPAPVAAPTTTAVVGVAALPRWAWTLGVALLAAQLLLALALWNSGRETRRALGGAERHLERTAHVLIGDISQHTGKLQELARPLVHSQGSGSEADFTRIRMLMQEGRFEEARRRLYGLLAVVDRHEAGERRAIEGRVWFLLGDAARLEADRLEDAP